MPVHKDQTQTQLQVLITQVPYFKGCEKAFLMECAMHIEEVVFAPMEVAQARGTIVSHLTIVRRGVIVAKGRVLTSGRVLGEESLYKEWPACYSARSMTFTDASQLNRTVLLQILKNFPLLLRSFCIRSIQGVFRCVLSFLFRSGTRVHCCGPARAMMCGTPLCMDAEHCGSCTQLLYQGACGPW